MTANAALVLDSVTDKIYSVNFEGEDELLLSEKLKESWPTFYICFERVFQVLMEVNNKQGHLSNKYERSDR